MSQVLINFSDWIILAFLLYISKASNFNPIFCVIFGIIHNIIFIICMIHKKCKLKKISIILAHFLIKIMMFIYLVINTQFNVRNLIEGIIYFSIYNFWLYKIHNMSIINLSFKNLDRMSENIPNEDKIDKINRVNNNKIKELNQYYEHNFDKINKNYKNILLKSNYGIKEISINDIYIKYKKKFNKINNNYIKNLYSLTNTN
jgi:hypothetical protein